MDVKPNLWIPITDLIDLAHLGKLGEEVNELGAAIYRCIIQGVGESEPVTGKPNKEWLEDEIADVLAMIDLATVRFKLDTSRMVERSERKVKMKQEWHAMLLPVVEATKRG
jgi:hypothetical protein